MELQTIYNNLFEQAVTRIAAADEEIDERLNGGLSIRRGITLRIRPPEAVRRRIGEMLDLIRQLEPDQYFYPDSDLHMTFETIMTARDGFRLDEVSPEDYLTLVRNCLAGCEPPRIRMNGLTASPGTVLIQGFPDNNRLNDMRRCFRLALNSSVLPKDADARYLLETAHLTAVRFSSKLRQRNELIRFLQANREYDFGSFDVAEIELVCNDWYHRAKNVELLGLIRF